MRSSHRIGVAFVALSRGLSDCLGPFNLTRRLYKWNAELGDKWEREIMFLILAITPVYGLTTLADAVVFNSMEFWTGKNPVDKPAARGEAPRQRRVARGDAEVVLTRLNTSPSTSALSMAIYRNGRLEDTVRFERRPDGSAAARDAQGRLVMAAQTLPDGRVVITDAQGRQVATSADPAASLASAAP